MTYVLPNSPDSPPYLPPGAPTGGQPTPPVEPPPAAQPPAGPPIGGRGGFEPNRRGWPMWLTALVVAGGVAGGAVAGGVVARTTTDDGSSVAAVPAIVTGSTGASATLATPPATAAGSTNVIASLVASTRSSVVSIHDSIAQQDQFGREVQGQAAGTGFVLTSDGYVATNNHVIDGATDISVNFADGTSAPATVVGADPNADLAVLKVDRTGLTPLAVGSSGAMQVGDQVVAIGNALDLSGEPTVTTGIVSATGRSLTEPNGVKLVDLIQTDTAINPGNSGGPLLNMAGEVVGINTAVAGQSQNIGFAIAIDPARALIDQLKAGQVPQHPLLGVATRTGADGRGAEVVQVETGSGAAAAGLQVGDVITAIDGSTIANPDALSSVIASHKVGDDLTVTCQRGGTSVDATVTLGSRPAGS